MTLVWGYRMNDAKRTESTEQDPRRRLAERYLQSAREDLAAKEAGQSVSHRRQASRVDSNASIAALAPSISGSTFVHALLLMFVLTLGALAFVWCFVLLSFNFFVGRIIALPTGVLVILGLSYASACYLGILESTSHGHTTPDDQLQGDWRDWFWSLPSTLGMFALATAVGYGLGQLAPDNTWVIVDITIWLLYPILQLSSLETGSPLLPFSVPVLRSLGTRVLAWMLFYGVSFLLMFIVGALAKAAWRDPPYVTMLLLGPIATVALLVYGWMLGQLARWLSLKGY